MEVVPKHYHIWRWRFIAVWVIAFTGFVAYQLHMSASTHSALCALKNDLVVRVRSGEQFLEEHPEGIQGIPASTIRDSLKNQKRTIHVLRGLDCPRS